MDIRLDSNDKVEVSCFSVQDNKWYDCIVKSDSFGRLACVMSEHKAYSEKSLQKTKQVNDDE